MRLIIGSYRGDRYLPRALDSIEHFVTGATSIEIVDDSPTAFWESALPTVVNTKGQGYNVAMKAVCELAGDDEFMFWEEDFVATEPIDLGYMSTVLEHYPRLAQLALLRGPHFPIEHELGGLLPALAHRIPGSVLYTEGEPFIEQTGTFTCNPAVWRAGIAAKGWPDGKWSEDSKRDHLLAEGYTFGFLPGIRVAHDGQRSGHGY